MSYTPSHSEICEGIVNNLVKIYFSQEDAVWLVNKDFMLAESIAYSEYLTTEELVETQNWIDESK